MRQKLIIIASCKFLCLFAMTFSSLTVFADDELEVARSALRDGLWECARNVAEKGTNDESRLIILESFACEGRWDEIGRRLEAWKTSTRPGFEYYRAVLKGENERAIKLLKEGGSHEGAALAKLHEADLLARSGKTKQAAEIWREISSSTNISERIVAVASANLMDVDVLRAVRARIKSRSLYRLLGLRLGVALLAVPDRFLEGVRLVRLIVQDSPEAIGAREALLAVADSALGRSDWKLADKTYHDAIETWPDIARIASVQEGRGWAFSGLGRLEDALEAFGRAFTLATNDEARAVALVKEGDVLLALGQMEESTARYQKVLEDYPKTQTAKGMESAVRANEGEEKGRSLYAKGDFKGAALAFSDVMKIDSSRQFRMKYYIALCLYGQGLDGEALDKMRSLVKCSHATIQYEATLWLAKFLFNRREWKASCENFVEAAALRPQTEEGAESLLWAARAAFSAKDADLAIVLTKRIEDEFHAPLIRAAALIVQGEALSEQGRFEEAVLVFSQVIDSDSVSMADRVRARLLKADALFAMGADNPSYYTHALDAYDKARFGGKLSEEEQIVVSFKAARTLEKLRRIDEAYDVYYAQVVSAYTNYRSKGVPLGEDARAAFSRAAFELANGYEGRGRDDAAINVLEHVVFSGIPAASEAKKRIEKIKDKGGF